VAWFSAAWQEIRIRSGRDDTFLVSAAVHINVSLSDGGVRDGQGLIELVDGEIYF
jgi:hypothetical protein